MSCGTLPWQGIEAHDLHPARALAGGIAADPLQRAGAAIDGMDRQHVRLLAADDDVASVRIDGEAARLALRGRAADVRQLAGRGVDTEPAEGAARALGHVEMPSVGRQMQVRRPDVALGVARRRRVRARCRRARHAGTKPRVGRQARCRAQRRQHAGGRIERERGHRCAQLAQQVNETVVGRDDEMARSGQLLHHRTEGVFDASLPVFASKVNWNTASLPSVGT